MNINDGDLDQLEGRAKEPITELFLKTLMTVFLHISMNSEEKRTFSEWLKEEIREMNIAKGNFANYAGENEITHNILKHNYTNELLDVFVITFCELLKWMTPQEMYRTIKHKHLTRCKLCQAIENTSLHQESN